MKRICRQAGLEKLEIVLFASASRLRTASVGQAGRGGRKGGLVFALPPVEPVKEISSDIFKYTPPFGDEYSELLKNHKQIPNIFMKEIINQLEKEVETFFRGEGSGHDMYHLKRTLNNALIIQEKEGGDRLIIAVSALLHDIHRIIQKQTGDFCSPKDSLPKIKEILNKTKLTEEQKEKILHCIEYHEEYNFSKNGKTANNIETLILQDADNLDAIGAIGVGRAFSFGGVNNIAMFIPGKPFDRDTFDESEKDLSTIHHFYSKLLKLKENMNTETAKKMANERHKFMELFLQEFFDEWEGKK